MAPAAHQLTAAWPSSAVDARLFRAALGRFATGVALITADDAGAPLGLIANSLASVSLSPPLLSFCPSRDSFTWARMRRARRFGVNLLGSQHEDYARRAAPAGADRLAGVAWEPTPTGVPRLAGAIAFLECAIEAEHPAGDHWIVVGRVEHAHVDPAGSPLLFWASRFAHLASHTSQTAERKATT
jgi:3-hydroxy-9,10-secoandrosta-1,3,5(10)-triene-9,17-dione monooxygenase reductase component